MNLVWDGNIARNSMDSDIGGRVLRYGYRIRNTYTTPLSPALDPSLSDPLHPSSSTHPFLNTYSQLHLPSKSLSHIIVPGVDHFR